MNRSVRKNIMFGRLLAGAKRTTEVTLNFFDNREYNIEDVINSGLPFSALLVYNSGHMEVIRSDKHEATQLKIKLGTMITQVKKWALLPYFSNEKDLKDRDNYYQIIQDAASRYNGTSTQGTNDSIRGTTEDAIRSGLRGASDT